MLSSRDRRGLTPLHKAVGLNKKEAAEFLLAKVVQLLLDGASLGQEYQSVDKFFR